MENSKPATNDPQAAAPSPGTTNQKPISGHKRRDEFICGILVCDGLTPLELKTAVRLAMFFNRRCRTGVSHSRLRADDAQRARRQRLPASKKA
jgi:hypothetical protein